MKLLVFQGIDDNAQVGEGVVNGSLINGSLQTFLEFPALEKGLELIKHFVNVWIYILSCL